MNLLAPCRPSLGNDDDVPKQANSPKFIGYKLDIMDYG